MPLFHYAVTQIHASTKKGYTPITSYDFKRLFTISKYYDKDRPAYYKAIQSVRKNKMDLTAWLEYFVDGLRAQMAEIYEKGRQIIIADKTDKLLEDMRLNIRQ